eukprot:4308990-Pleurochrysis_carterae.AAC.5
MEAKARMAAEKVEVSAGQNGQCHGVDPWELCLLDASHLTAATNERSPRREQWRLSELSPTPHSSQHGHYKARSSASLWNSGARLGSALKVAVYIRSPVLNPLLPARPTAACVKSLHRPASYAWLDESA